MKKIKVIQLTSDYIPKPLWGMGWHVVFLFEELKKRNYEVYVGTTHKSHNVHENIITTSWEEDEIGLSKNEHEIFNDYHRFNRWQIKLAERILKKEIQFEIIHCHNWMSWLTAKKIKKSSNVKTVVTFHFLQKQYELMNENPIPSYHSEIIKIEKEMVQHADQVIVLSNRHYNLLMNEYQLWKFKDKINIINNGVNFEKERYYDIEKKRKLNPYTDLIFVGRVERDKGIIQTLIASQKIVKENKKVRLHIAGEGSLLPKLKKEYSSKQIIFHGFVDKDVLKKILIKSSIFCMPSSSEAFPVAVIEAMMFGVVPVFSKGETVPNLFKDDFHGVKIPLYLERGVYNVSAEDLYFAIKKLIKNPILLKKMSKNAYLYANKNLTSRNMVDNIINVYNKL